MEEDLKTYAEYYLGTITEVLDRSLYQIKCDIPGVFDGVKAFPVRGEIDEPKVGDFVLLRSFDPVYHSYFLYQKLKENDFIGFRSFGKMVEIDPNGEYIQVCTFDPEFEYSDGDQKKGVYKPDEVLDWVKMDKDGNLDINLRANHHAVIGGNGEIEVKGNVTVKVSGNSNIEVSGDSSIKSSGSCTIDSPDVKITGAKLTISGTPGPPGTSGPLCGIPTCPFSGLPHLTTLSSNN